MNKGRIVAIDYGSKRCGIAITDELQLIANGLTTVETKQIFSFLDQYFINEKVCKVIIGIPKRMNNEFSDIAGEIKLFQEKFISKYPQIEVVNLDERFTSKMAFQTMIDSGLSKKQRQNKALVDEIAATILLQDYLNYYK